MNKMLFMLLTGIFMAGCTGEKPLISNPARLADMERMLKIQKELTANALIPVWSALDQPLSDEEGLALKFLYAYMPLSDLADYSPEFMLANVRNSLQTRKETPWGTLVPEEAFLHFVLPLRVNNENLDSFRLACSGELKSRIKGMSMKEAALEINHWCHEKVNYRGTDARTSAPLSTIRKTFGRCGEESTFTVAAMRAAGIPSRQVYTPRWAHTDDNHAWVEVWVDGAWHYMGACEPEAVLDRGWFSEPSQRTMMIHTRTYGRYFGNEEVLDAEDRFSELNLTANYADTKRVTVLVTDSLGKAVPDVKVEFKLYNYAEFYPIATTFTGPNGTAGLTTGMGDLLVWASAGNRFAFDVLHVRTTDTLKLVLGKTVTDGMKFLYDLVPPKATRELPAVSEQEQKANQVRLTFEDSLRNNTMSTFKDSAWISNYAHSRQLPADTLMRILRLSYGNWQEMLNYVEQNIHSYRRDIFKLTYGISAKDLSDTKASILSDHLLHAPLAGNNQSDRELYEKYILAPRIGLEILSSWRSFLLEKMGTGMANASRKDINVLLEWIKSGIKVDPVANKHSRAPLTPIGVFNLRVADPVSRNIFFVAGCRTFGIPARLNPETLLPEYYSNGNWFRAGFENQPASPELGRLFLKDKNNSVPPQYALHFTIARIQDGRSQTLEFEEGKKVTEFPSPVLLETGLYMLVTGRRLSDASVLSSVTFFDVTRDKTANLEVELRKETTALQSKGKFDPSGILLSGYEGKGEVRLSDCMKNKNSVIVLLDPDSEPTKHILNDLAPYAEQLDGWDGRFIFVISKGKEKKTDTFRNYRLPSKKDFAIDFRKELENMLSGLPAKIATENLPVVIFCQPSGDIMMASEGYKIGMGEQLLQLIKRMEEERSLMPAPSCTTP